MHGASISNQTKKITQETNIDLTFSNGLPVKTAPGEYLDVVYLGKVVDKGNLNLLSQPGPKAKAAPKAIVGNGAPAAKASMKKKPKSKTTQANKSTTSTNPRAAANTKTQGNTETAKRSKSKDSQKSGKETAVNGSKSSKTTGSGKENAETSGELEIKRDDPIPPESPELWQKYLDKKNAEEAEMDTDQQPGESKSSGSKRSKSKGSKENEDNGL